MRTNQGKIDSPIFITGADRSGSSLIARIVKMRGVYAGDTNKMLENKVLQTICLKYIEENTKVKETLFPDFTHISTDWHDIILKKLNTKVGENDYMFDQWMFKSSLLTQMWKQWDLAFPNAKWIIVRRRSADIINSCTKTGYMQMFKAQYNQRLVNAQNEEEAWKWWIHKYEEAWVEMITKGVNCKVVYPERMVTGDYSQIYDMLDWLGLDWCPSIPNTIGPLLIQNRRK